MKIDAYMYYFDAKYTHNDNLIPGRFKKYNIKYVTKINDDKSNVLIIPEVYTKFLYKYKNIQKGIWWLSFDFYYTTLIKNRAELALKKRGLSQRLKPLLQLYFIIKECGHKQFEFDKDKNINNYFHLYNCEYIKQILLKNGINEERTLYLCGPIGKVFLENTFSDGNKKI